jgi:hypothetical protein
VQNQEPVQEEYRREGPGIGRKRVTELEAARQQPQKRTTGRSWGTRSRRRRRRVGRGKRNIY